MKISAAEALIEVIQKKVDPSVCKMICDAAFRVVWQTRAENMFEAWGEILVVVLPNVRWNDHAELRQALKLLESFAGDSEDISRKLASRVFGSLSACLTQQEVEEFVLPKAIELTADRNLEVRGMIAESMAFIGARTAISTVEIVIWPKLLSLLKDPEARIHAATLRTIAHILDAHRAKSSGSMLYSELIAPVFARECDFARKAATQDQRTVDEESYLLLEIVSEVFGQFIFSLYPHFADEGARKEAYKAFLAMATCNGPIVRRYCAFNIPGVSKSLVAKYGGEMASIVEFLSRDTDSETRWNLAAGMHETASILATRTTIDNLFKSVSTLLQDENPLVRMNTLEHFYPLLQSLTRESESGSMRKLAPVFQNLTLLSEGNWRTQELLAKQLEKAASLVLADTLRSNVLPLLYQMSEESTYLVRKATMPAIAKALWCIPVPQEREETVREFRAHWAEGGVFWMRLAFIDCARAATECYSSALFKNLFSASTLRMAEDPVANVRLRLGTVIDEFAPACWDLPQFQHAITVLKEDNDNDVIQVMKDADSRIDTKMSRREVLRLEDSDRERAELDLVERYQRNKSDLKKRQLGIGIFRPSAMLTKGPTRRLTGLDLDAPSSPSSTTTAGSPTSIADSNQTKYKDGFSPSKKMPSAMSPASPRNQKSEITLSKKTSSPSGRDLNVLDIADSPNSVSSPRKKVATMVSDPSDDDDDVPRSFGKRLLSLGKKPKR
jgi:hypothetical protein